MFEGFLRLRIRGRIRGPIFLIRNLNTLGCVCFFYGKVQHTAMAPSVLYLKRRLLDDGMNVFQHESRVDLFASQGPVVVEVRDQVFAEFFALHGRTTTEASHEPILVCCTDCLCF